MKSESSNWIRAFGKLVVNITAGIVGLTGLASAAVDSTRGPSTAKLLHAGSDDTDWLLPEKSYAGNRYTTLTQIDKTNVGDLALAWQTDLADEGRQEAASLVWNGIMYVSTAHDGVLALDASTGKLRWQAPYNPSYVLLFSVNRGVGLADGKVFIATQDCRILALDAMTGKSVWNVQGCRDPSNSFYSMAAYVYKNEIIVGTGGGDNGATGLISAFSVKDGTRLWDWQTIPGPGQPGHETWPGDSWKHGGGAAWSGLAVDQSTDTLFVAPGNPGAGRTPEGRQGRKLYTDSLVALDISGAQPRIKWYYQLIQNDTHDNDPAMIPVLFEGRVGNRMRSLVAIGDKVGHFVILDRATGQPVHRLILSTHVGFDTPSTLQGVTACRKYRGGTEWNGGAFDPASNSFLVPSRSDCGMFKHVAEDNSSPVSRAATGVLTSIDVDSGKVRWRRRLPYAAEGGVLITSTGLAFTSDVGGNLYAFDAATGEQYWKSSTGSCVVAPISAYSVNGIEYLTVLVGRAGDEQPPNLPPSAGSRVLTYTIGNAPLVVNTSSGQVMPTSSSNGAAAADVPKSTGSAPYTPQQVALGRDVYTKQCASCHGASLQGVAAPTLTGPGLARSHLNASQLRDIVVQSMPLTAPGTLSPNDYAAVMAYLLSYDCVTPAEHGTQPFPTTSLASLQQVQIGGTTCPPES